MKNAAYYNGKICAIEDMMVPMNDRACYYGDGVYDAAAVMNKVALGMDEHIDRFFRSAAFVRIEVPMDKQGLKAMLRDLIGKSKDDPLWDKFMDQMTVEEMATLIGTGCYNTQAFEQYGIPHTVHGDGPVGFVDFLKSDLVKDREVCGYASECVTGASWNKQLAYEMGI